jgi:tetratricopeptide (TPR) repeat protein
VLEVAGQPESVSRQMERMIAHPPLVSSPSLSRFLRYIVEETLAGRGEAITEFSLGVRVFNRGEDFNPRMDPIVRVQAHHLRARMVKFYAGPGVNDTVRIELPGRTYIPVFHSLATPGAISEPATAAAAAEPGSVSGLTAPPDEQPPASAPRKLSGSLLVTVVAAFVSIAAMAALWRIYTPAYGAGMPQKAAHIATPAAQDLYSRGRYLMDRQSEQALHQSIECFQQAIALDGQFAAAYAGLADSYNLLAQFGYISPRDGMEAARTAAERALTIDPQLADAHVSLAEIEEAYDWNWPAAEKEYRRAIALNSTLAAAHLWYGMFLRDQNRMPEAMPELRRAEELEPLSVLGAMNMAHGLMKAGDSKGALERAQRAVDLDPELPTASLLLASAYRKVDDNGDAEAALVRARALAEGNPHALAQLGNVYTKTGRRSEALRVYGELQTMASHRYVSPFDLGNLSLQLGEEDRAITQFEEAYRQRSVGLIFLRNDAPSFKDCPRMQSLISKIRAG